MSKKITNIAGWIVVCLLVLAIAYAFGLIHWIISVIAILLFIAVVLFKYDSQSKDSE